MKKYSVLFLKLSIILLMIPVILLGGYGLYWLSRNPVHPRYDQMIYPVLSGLYLASFPVIYAGIKFYQLLSLVGKDRLNLDTKEDILSKLIKAAISVGAIFMLMLPFVFMIAEEDDAPGLIIVAFMPVMISTIFAALFTLFQESPGGKMGQRVNGKI